ncbi:MAG: hypothetical protein WC511_03255 [Candidatus Pacearchaeota archaeon]
MAIVKYFTEMKTAAPETPAAPPAPPAAPDKGPAGDVPPPPPMPEGSEMDAPPEENPATKEVEKANPEKDAVKFKLQVEQKASEQGHSVTVSISSTNKTMSITLNAEEDIITQKDAIKLAVTVDDLDPNWRLMDEPLQKAGPSWAIRMTRNK